MTYTNNDAHCQQFQWTNRLSVYAVHLYSTYVLCTRTAIILYYNVYEGCTQQYLNIIVRGKRRKF